MDPGTTGPFYPPGTSMPGVSVRGWKGERYFVPRVEEPQIPRRAQNGSAGGYPTSGTANAINTLCAVPPTGATSPGGVVYTFVYNGSGGGPAGGAGDLAGRQVAGAFAATYAGMTSDMGLTYNA